MILLLSLAGKFGQFYDWLDRTDVALWVTAIATAVLAVGVFFALLGLWDARKTRDGQLVIDLARRWNEQDTVESKVAFSVEGPTKIIALMQRAYEPEGDQPASEVDLAQFWVLTRWPNLIETIGVLHKHGTLSTRVVYRMWGAGILYAWTVWEEPVKELRRLDRSPDTFQYFEQVGAAMRKRATWAARWRRLRRR